MPRKVGAVGASSSNDGACCFCGLKEDKELEYGKIHEYNGIVTHYYCLLLSSNMQQKGRDDEGILGFLPEDINKELRRGKRLNCAYCKKTGATLGCCNTKCRKIFHFPCGLKSGSLHQFFGEFRSYCRKHRPRQRIDVDVSEEVKMRDDMICYICYDEVNPTDKYRTLWAPCCKKNAWFHRSCVQQLAMSAGYFFKCPLCNNKTDFQRAMLNHGIFIPSQDASWELVPNAFEELLYRHNRCDADECLCPKGREHTSANAKWELTLCRTCGSQGIHMACGQLKWVKPVWECGECTSILNKTIASDTESNSLDRTLTGREKIEDEENDDDTSDSDISVGIEDSEQSSPSKNPDDELTIPREFRSHDERVRVTRRSVIHIPKSPVNTRIQSPKASTTTSENEDSPTKSKRPRYSNFTDQRDAIDSDDDVMVISGPSRSESPSFDERKSSDKSIFNASLNSEDFYPILKKEPDSEVKNSEKTSPILSNALKKPEASSLSSFNRVTSETEKRVIEIDLSESECVIPEPKSSKTIVNEIPVANSSTTSPELKFMITNVTSLAPEAFDQQEQKFDINSTKIQPTSSNFNQLTGGLTSQTAIILDDEPLPQTPINITQAGNNLRFVPNGLNDQITIVRFNGISNTTGENTVFYGLNIPGTNQTIPLIFTPVESPTTTSTQVNDSVKPSNAISFTGNENLSDKPLNNNSIPPLAPLSSVNETAMNDSFKQSAATTIPRDLEAPSRPTPTLSMSVPLKSIVNESFPTTPVSSKKSVDKNSNPTVGPRNKNPFGKVPSLVTTPKCSAVSSTVSPVKQQKISVNQQKLDVTEEKSPVPQRKTSVVEENTPTSQSSGSFSKKHAVDAQANNNSLPNTFGLPPLTRKPMSSPQRNNNKLNDVSGPLPTLKPFVNNAEAIKNLSKNIDTNMIAKMLTTLPKEASRISQICSTNGINDREPRISTYGHSRERQKKKTSGNRVELVPYTSHLSQSTQLQIQKSAENKQSNVEPSNVYQVFGTDSNGSNDDCDGDAGSGPAVQPASATDSTNAKSSDTRHDREITCGGAHTSLQVGELSVHERTSGGRSDSDTDDEVDRSSSSDWSDSSDRAGLIYKRINLRNINFSVRDTNFVKMTLYDTYSVNISVDSCKTKRYSSCTKTSKSSLNSEAIVSDTKRCDNEKIASQLDIVTNVKLGNDDVSNKFQDNTSRFSSTESTNSTNDLSRTNLESRRQEELKENLDPIPLTTNSSNNSVYIVDRKNKLRPRSGGNQSMRSLNDKEDQQTINEKSEISMKVTSQEFQSVVNCSNVFHNGWKDNGSNDETIDPNITLADRNVEIPSKNLSRRNSSVNENSDNSIFVDSSDINASKRKRTIDDNLSEIEKAAKLMTQKTLENSNYTNHNHLVNGEINNTKRKWNSSDDISRPKKLRVNNIIKGRRASRDSEPISCKVSIDLAKIKDSLTVQLKNTETLRSESRHKRRLIRAVNTTDQKKLHHSKSLIALPKSRSFDNLTLESRYKTIPELRKSKSFENLRKFCPFVNLSTEMKNHNCKINKQNFEKHDCVR